MKRRNFIKHGALWVPTLLLARKSAGQIGLQSPGFVGQLSKKEIGAAQTWLLQETFEGTGYDNPQGVTFSETGTVDENETGVVLDGSQSASITYTTATGGITTVPALTAVDSIYSYFLFRMTAMPTTITSIYLIQTGATVIGQIYVLADGRMGARQGTGTAAYTVNTVSINTTYHVWFRYSKGTGSNGIATVGFSTDGTKPTSGNGFAQCTNGNKTDQANTCKLYGNKDGTGGVNYYDKWYVSDSEIGSNP